MMRNIFALSAAIATALILNASLPAQTKNHPGKAVYTTKCAACHAKTGAGSQKTAERIGVSLADLNLIDSPTQARKDSELETAVRDGGKEMKGYKTKLTEQQIKDVVAYIRTLVPPKK